jgi:hypothetical protein
MAKRRLKNADEAFMGPQPSYGVHNPVPTSEKDRMNEWMKATRWFYYFENKKQSAETVQVYCTRILNFNKKQISNLKKLPDWKYRMKAYQAIAMQNAGWTGYPLDERLETINEHLWAMEKEGAKIKKELDKKPKVVPISPAVRMRRKVLDTIYADFDTMVVDKWMEDKFDKKEVIFPTYSLLQLHKIKGAGLNMFRDLVQAEYDVISDAYHKKCEQAVEGYSHITKGNKKKMLDLMDKIFEDIERMRTNSKATRTRIKKPKTSDKQVEKLQYMTENVDAKLISINPVLIPGKNKLYIYNCKNKKLQEYVTTSTSGFEISGTSIKNFDKKLSKQSTLRKPDIVLPDVLTKTEKQIEKIWNTLTTKIDNPTGRINKDCILLRVF